MPMCVSRIVCEMGKAEKSQYTGNVQVCVGVGECRPEFMAKSSKYYYFVVSVCLYYLIISVLKNSIKSDDIQCKNKCIFAIFLE